VKTRLARLVPVGLLLGAASAQAADFDPTTIVTTASSTWASVSAVAGAIVLFGIIVKIVRKIK